MRIVTEDCTGPADSKLERWLLRTPKVWRADDVTLDKNAVVQKLAEMYDLSEPGNWTNAANNWELAGNRDAKSWRRLIEDTLGGRMCLDTSVPPGFHHVLITLQTPDFSVMLPLQVRRVPCNLTYEERLGFGTTLKLGTLGMVQDWLNYSCRLVSSRDWMMLIVLAYEWQRLLRLQDDLIRREGMRMLMGPWRSYALGQPLPRFGMRIEDVNISVDLKWMVKRQQEILKTFLVDLRKSGRRRGGNRKTILRLSPWILNPDQYPEFWSKLRCGPKEWKFLLQNTIVFDLLVLFMHKKLPVEVMLLIIEHASPNVTGTKRMRHKDYEKLVYERVEAQQAAVRWEHDFTQFVRNHRAANALNRQ